MWFVFTGLSAGGVGLLVASARGGPDGPPPGFVVFWLFALGWNAYWWLFRISIRLEVQGDLLRWKTASRAGEIPLTELLAVRPSRLASQIIVIERANGKPILSMATKGNGRFLAEIASRRPDLPIRVGMLAKLSDRLPGWSAFRDDGGSHR